LKEKYGYPFVLVVVAIDAVSALAVLGRNVEAVIEGGYWWRQGK
jgi:hypothetical protein